MKKNLVLALLLPLVILSACTEKPVAPKPRTAGHRIGIVFDVGGRGDKSFNDSAYAGLRLVASTYKGFIKDDPDKVDFGKEVELKYLEPKRNGPDREQLLRLLSEEGYDLIFGVGFMFTDSITRVAKDFPEVHYAIIDVNLLDLTESSNLTCLGFAEEEGSFLAGALAGLATLDKPKAKVGFIGGMDAPLIHRFQAGFSAGAAYTNPGLRRPGMILSQYIGKDSSAFGDPGTAAAIATTMYKAGAGIIFAAAGGSGTGLLETARALGKDCIGVDTDQGYGYSSNDKDPGAKEIGRHILSSMLKRVDQAVFLTSEELIKTGKVKGGYRTYDLRANGVGLALNTYNKDRLEPYMDRLDELKARIMAGEIRVPSDDASAEAFIKALK